MAATDWLITDFPASSSGTLKITCTDAAGSPFDFSAWTLTFRLKTRGSPAAALTKTGASVTAAAGVVSIALAAGEVTVVGRIPGVIEATKAGLQQDWIGILEVREHA